MGAEEIDEMGPVDYLVVEWPGKQPTGEAVPHLLELVDSGLIRIIDLAFVTKDENGAVAEVEISQLGRDIEGIEILEGASSGLLSNEDFDEAANALENGTAAALIVYENRWAGPFAAAVRRSGGQLVASGRIPVQAILGALDASESNN